MIRRRSNIQLNGDVVRRYLESRGITMPRLAADLDVNYSHFYRLVKGEKNVGIRFYLNLQRYCERKGLNYQDFFVEIKDEVTDL